LLTGRVVFAAIAALAAVLALAGCGSSGRPAPASTHVKAEVAPSHPRIPWTFTVRGDHRVLPNGSQDTHAATPGAVCGNDEFARDAAIGRQVATGFALAGLSASADLLEHFLAGQGTEIDYGPRSSIARQAMATMAFRAMNKQVQGAILEQLKAGQAQVRLSAAQLPTVAFTSTTGDLYWGFRGTQGLTVTGSGTRGSGRYAGTVTYVIRDSYGFPADDTLDGFGPPMRYLQTVCGAPQHAGGAHWFPDTITVTVPLNQPA
jgi:hypothetical protein